MYKHMCTYRLFFHKYDSADPHLQPVVTRVTVEKKGKGEKVVGMLVCIFAMFWNMFGSHFFSKA